MKVTQNFGILYVLLVIGQVIMCNYTYLGPYVMLSMLPAMIFCLPTKFNTVTCMLIAFGSAFAVDWLSEGLIGINMAALVPAALARNGVIKIFLGDLGKQLAALHLNSLHTKHDFFLVCAKLARHRCKLAECL